MIIVDVFITVPKIHPVNRFHCMLNSGNEHLPATRVVNLVLFKIAGLPCKRFDFYRRCSPVYKFRPLQFQRNGYPLSTGRVRSWTGGHGFSVLSMPFNIPPPSIALFGIVWSYDLFYCPLTCRPLLATTGSVAQTGGYMFTVTTPA